MADSNHVQFSRRSLALLYLLALIVIAIVSVTAGRSNPSTFWIEDLNDARWIQPDQPAVLGMYRVRDRLTLYGVDFEIDEQPDTAVLTIDVFNDQRVELDGKLILDFDPDHTPTPGRISRSELDIAPLLEPGEHRLEIIVKNDIGPQILLAYAEDIGLYTDTHWDYTDENMSGDVRRATEPKQAITQGSSKTIPSAAISALPIVILLFGIGLSIQFRAEKHPNLSKWLIHPGARFTLIALFLLLGLNNMMRIGPTYGMDASAHYDYVEFILSNLSIPLASEGIFAFRAPLIYIMAAPFLALFNEFFDPDTAYKCVRILPILLGALQIELGHRILRNVYPQSRPTVALGTLLVAFSPINVYMAQYLSDEVAAAMTGALLILYMTRVLYQEIPPTLPQTAAIGALLGLAFLAKVSTLLLLPPCFLVMLWCLISKSNTLKPTAIAAHTGVAALASILVSGWYFFRNKYYLGQFFVAGWDVEQYQWWQPPGFRTSEHYLQFGGALTSPVFSGFSSFWDGLYASVWLDGWTSAAVNTPPDWNFNFMTAGTWLAMFPTMLLAAGILGLLISMLRDPENVATPDDIIHMFSGLCITHYLWTMLYIHMTTPIYSAVKGSYFLAILPCLVLLMIKGIRVLEAKASPAMRQALRALIATWAITAYLTYFII